MVTVRHIILPFRTFSHTIRPVAIKFMNLQRSARLLAWTSHSMKRSEQDDTMSLKIPKG